MGISLLKWVTPNQLTLGRILLIPLLLVLSFINGIAWGFWPILFTVPFHLPGIRPRELSVAVA